MPSPIYCTVQGQTQGAIKGSCTITGKADTILVQGLEHNVGMPTDPQSGLPTGKRVHMPLTITKFVDMSSPKLYQALTSGEHLTKVTLDFYRIANTGKEEKYYSIELDNAVITGMRPWISNVLLEENKSLQHMEDVSFTYQKITWNWIPDSFSAEDDWQAPK